jgi:hypothetical protein
MYDPMLLYEREKFFDFVQASLRAGFEFEQPALTLQRSKTLLNDARNIWLEFSEFAETPTPLEVKKYLLSLFCAINAVAELNGPPINERRLLLEFPARAEAAQKQNMVATAYQLIGANKVDADKIKSWLSDWKSAFKLASEKTNVDSRIHSTRVNYYDKAIKAMLDGETPLASLWPLLLTWTLSSEVLSGDHLKFWQKACTELNLLDHFAERIEGLDQFLDEIEIMFEEIATANGLNEESTGI